MKREFLKDGNWIDVRDKDEVTVKGRRGIQAISLGLKDLLNAVSSGQDGEAGEAVIKISDLSLTEEQADAMLRLQEATIVALIAEWSFPEPAPTLATVGDMPGGRFDEIAELTKGVGADIALDTSATTEPDPKGPSGNSGLSAGLSKVV